MKPLRIAIITTDGRKALGQHSEAIPSFGAAPLALLQGFSILAKEKQNILDIHVISCSQQNISSLKKLNDNIFFHSLYVPKKGWLRTGYQGCICAVREKLKEINPDIVHGQGTERDCALSALLSGYPNIITIHGNMRSIAQKLNARFASYHWITARLESIVLRHSQGVICNSEYTRNQVGNIAKNTWLIPNALRSSFFDLPVLFKKGNIPHFLNIGTVCSYKQQIKLLEIMKNIYNEKMVFRISFVGSLDAASVYGKQFLDKINGPEYRGFASYVGNKNLNDIINIMDQSTALIHVPSEEAFGLVVAEALARNLKIFTFDTGGLADIVSGISSAEVVKDQNWQFLESSIIKWMIDGYVKPLKSSDIIASRYHPKTIAEKHLEIYSQVLRKIQ